MDSVFKAAQSKDKQSGLIPRLRWTVSALTFSHDEILAPSSSVEEHSPLVPHRIFILRVFSLVMWFVSNKSNMNGEHKILQVSCLDLPITDSFLMGGGPLLLQPRGGSGPRPAAAPAGGSFASAGRRAGWPAPPPGCIARTGGGCRQRRSAASWGGSAAVFPAEGPWRRNEGHQTTRTWNTKTCFTQKQTSTNPYWCT